MTKTAVAIPLYNHADYIVETLQSALDQTRPPDRIIIVDDGSQDESVARARSVVDSRVEIIQQSNSGAHSALNRAVSQATDCEYVALLNSDDRFLPQRLEQMLAVLEGNKEIQLACSGLRLIDDAGKLIPPDSGRYHWFKAAWSASPEKFTLCERLGLSNFLATTSNFVARREWLLQNPFRPYRYVHDYFMLADAAIRGVLSVNKDVLLEYRIHGANTISTTPENLIRELQLMNLDLMAHLAPFTPDPAVRRGLADYFRASWANITGFQAGVFQSMLAKVCARLTPEERTTLNNTFTATGFPELNRHQNRAAVKLFTERHTLGTCSNLAEKVAELEAALKQSDTEKRQAIKSLHLFRSFAESKWVKLGALLGSKRCQKVLANFGENNKAGAAGRSEMFAPKSQ